MGNPRFECSINKNYRAVYFKDGDNYIWEWIGPHEDFDKKY